MKKKDTRITVTIKLVPGVDDDLINWWSGLPLGSNQDPASSRNTRAKNLLRYTIGDDDRIAALEAQVAAERLAKAQAERQLDLEQSVRSAMSNELEGARQAAADLQGDVDLLREQSSKAFEQHEKEIRTLQGILSQLPTIAKKSVEQFVPPQDDGRMREIEEQIADLMDRIEEIAQLRVGAVARTPKKKTLTADELAERNRRMQNTNW